MAATETEAGDFQPGGKQYKWQETSEDDGETLTLETRMSLYMDGSFIHHSKRTAYDRFDGETDALTSTSTGTWEVTRGTGAPQRDQQSRSCASTSTHAMTMHAIIHLQVCPFSEAYSLAALQMMLVQVLP